MDETQVLAIGTAVDVVKPAITSLVSDLFGLALADYVGEIRHRRLDLFQRRTKALMAERDAKEKVEISPEALEQVFDGVLHAETDDLIELWAKLLATASDPNRKGTIRPVFMTTLRAFDAIDAILFLGLCQVHGKDFAQANRLGVVASQASLTADEAEVSAEHLGQLRLLVNPSGNLPPGLNPNLTSLGRELARALGLL